MCVPLYVCGPVACGVYGLFGPDYACNCMRNRQRCGLLSSIVILTRLAPLITVTPVLKPILEKVWVPGLVVTA